MDLKHALSVCLISLFASTLVVLIARSLDSQAAGRLEPYLERIAAELEAIRAAGGVGGASAVADSVATLQDGLIVYYFHGNTRCATCRAIESQSRATVRSDFAAQLDRGDIQWKTLNYEDPGGAALARQFDIQVPVVVLARMRNGVLESWQRLDEVWALVGDQPAFAQYIRAQIDQLLSAPPTAPAGSEPAEPPSIPIPDEPAVGSLRPAGGARLPEHDGRVVASAPGRQVVDGSTISTSRTRTTRP